MCLLLAVAAVAPAAAGALADMQNVQTFIWLRVHIPSLWVLVVL
jgi:hypothetical protein